MLGWRQFRNTRYLVNECGNVMNMRTGRQLKQCGAPPAFCFRIDGKNVRFRKDFLVATLFVPNPNKYKYIAHKNGDASDNHYTNLVWVEYLRRFHKSKSSTGVRGVQERNGYYVACIDKVCWGKFDTVEEAEFEYLEALHAFYPYPPKKLTDRYRELLPIYRNHN